MPSMSARHLHIYKLLAFSYETHCQGSSHPIQGCDAYVRSLVMLSLWGGCCQLSPYLESPSSVLDSSSSCPSSGSPQDTVSVRG